MDRPQHFPELPDNREYGDHVVEARNLIADSYNVASNLLLEEGSDHIRLRIHAERLLTRFVPLLEALERELRDEQWITEAASAFFDLTNELNAASRRIASMESTHISYPELAYTESSGGPGRPKIVIDKSWLKEAISRSHNISQERLARTLNISQRTLRSRIRDYGLVKESFDNITDDTLDDILRDFKQHKQQSGRRYAAGHLRTLGYRIQRDRIEASLRRIDGLGQEIRRHQLIYHRQYCVPRSNHLWHIDGHHKLIAWGIVIHGVIDGFCRTITGLNASSDNKSSTVLLMFRSAVEAFGLPSRVRGDRGGENVDVATLMVMLKGRNRGSFLWGPSTRNTRIERLWVEVGSQFARPWKAFFIRLENLHGLQRDNARHLWLLHYLFLPMIDDSCKTFQKEWNRHPISNTGLIGKELSPLDMRFLSNAERGIVIDDHEGVHPDILQQFYGVDVPNVDDGNADSDSDDEIEAQVFEALQEQLEGNEVAAAHEAVAVPHNQSPFDSIDSFNLFKDALQQVLDENIIPDGYGVMPEELEETGYPTEEILRGGRRGRKEMRIPLSIEVWLPRAIQWCQALEVMSTIVIEQEF